MAKIPKKTPLGGRYGTSIAINFATTYVPKREFLNDLEKSNIEYDIDYLLNIWTAKESIYKAIGVKGASFSKNIIIDCVSGKEKEGEGYYINGNEKTKFNLKFFYLDNYTICYAYEY